MIENVPTVGDPVAMRVLAAALVDRAGMIAGLSGRTTTAVQGATFEGPASTRVRAVVAEAGSQASQAVTRLHELAASLRVDASEVERQNEALRREAEAKAAAEAEAAAKAAAEASATAAAPATPAAVGAGPVATPAATPVSEPTAPTGTPIDVDAAATVAGSA